MKIMFVVTHLLGTGHLARTLTLARAFDQAGHTVTVVSGGLPAPHLDAQGLNLVQLPPLRSDGVDFTKLLAETDAAASPAHLLARQTQLLDVLSDTQPDVLVTELFPFGRRILREEFQAVLAKARTASGQPLIFASIRDILAPPQQAPQSGLCPGHVGPLL